MLGLLRSLLLLALIAGGIAYIAVERKTELGRIRGCLFERTYPFIPKLDRDFDFTVDLYGVTYAGNTGNYLDAHVLFTGAYEKPILFFMRDYAARLNSKESVFVDVGANTGQHSLFMSKHVHTVHAFEPWPPVLARFNKMIEMNHIQNIVVHPVGLGSEPARLPFFEQTIGGGQATGTFVAERARDALPTGTFEVLMGDAALAQAGADRVDLMKIDVEGFEKHVLLGLRETLNRSRPVITMELARVAGKPRFKDADDLRASFPPQYRFRVFSRDDDLYTGYYRLDEFDFDLEEDNQIVAYPQEKESLVPVELAQAAARCH